MLLIKRGNGCRDSLMGLIDVEVRAACGQGEKLAQKCNKTVPGNFQKRSLIN